MTTPDLILPDLVIDLKPWIIAHPRLAPLHGGRVFWQFPDGLNTYPAIRMYDAVPPMIQPSGGGAPVVDAHIAFDIWGGSDEDFVAVKAITTTLTAVLHQIQPDTIIGGTMIKDADLSTGAFSPDPATGWPRYVLDARITCVSAL